MEKKTGTEVKAVFHGVCMVLEQTVQAREKKCGDGRLWKSGWDQWLWGPNAFGELLAWKQQRKQAGGIGNNGWGQYVFSRAVLPWYVARFKEWMADEQMAESGCEKRFLESGERKARLWNGSSTLMSREYRSWNEEEHGSQVFSE